MAMAGTAALGPRVADELVLSIINDRAAARCDARGALFGRPLHVAAAPGGIAFLTGRSAVAYRWTDVKEVLLRRDSVLVRTESLREVVVPKDGHSEVRRFVERRTRAFRLVVDDVEEASLSATYVRVLDEMRSGTFSYSSTAWHEHQNAVERLEHDFVYQDDHVLPVAAAGLWLALGVVSAIVIAAAINVAAARAVPAGAFALSHRIAPYDPRSVVAGLALSVMLTTVVLRLGLGPQAALWIRGAARGWHRGRGRIRQWAVRQIGRALLSASTGAAVLLLALLAFWPSIGATVFIDAQGIRNEVLLPLVGIDESWRTVMQIERVGAQNDPNDRAGVLFRFVDGGTVTTVGSDLGGGTEGQLYDVALRWWKAAPR